MGTSGDPAPTAAPPHFRPMPIVAKPSPISATAELLLSNYFDHLFTLLLRCECDKTSPSTNNVMISSYLVAGTREIDVNKQLGIQFSEMDNVSSCRRLQLPPLSLVPHNLVGRRKVVGELGWYGCMKDDCRVDATRVILTWVVFFISLFCLVPCGRLS